MSENTAATRPDLSRGGRYLVLIVAFLGWLFAGTIMVIVPLAGRTALRQMGLEVEAEIGRWFSWWICSFLLGAALGGLFFGWLGDVLGRTKAMGLSILCYTLLTGLSYWVDTPAMFLVFRFLACMGVGGMWPNGVALVSEAWSNVSRPLLSGLIGTAANLGFVLLGFLASDNQVALSIASAVGVDLAIRPDNWRWVLIFATFPLPLGLIALWFVPESPRWLARRQVDANEQQAAPVREVFFSGLWKFTLLGILLGMIPLLGNWGGANWLVPWAGQVGGDADPYLKGTTQTVRSTGAAIGALLGGWLALLFGRRTAYFIYCALSLASSQYLFAFLEPGQAGFMLWVFLLGFFGTIFFGWLPLYLPELFPTRVRSTGTGVAFNFGRIVTVAGVMAAGQLMIAFDGDYGRVGQITSLIYVVGLIVICFAPDTSQRQLQD